MEGALLKLLAFRARGALRTRLRQLTSFRGLLYFAIACLVPSALWLMLDPVNVSSVELLDTSSQSNEALLVLGLIGATLIPVLTTSAPAFGFSAEEDHFLRSAPFRHQSLLLYKLLSAFSGAALTALLLAILTAAIYERLPVAVFCGTLLTLLFIRLAAATAIGSRRLFRQRRLTVLLKGTAGISLLGLASTVIWFGILSVYRLPPDASVHTLSAAAGHYALLPFRAFVQVTLAERMFPDLAVWASLAVTINLFLLVLLLRIERHLESHVDEEQTHHATASDRSQSQTGWCAVVAMRLAAGRFAGAGPIAGRQLAAARRSSALALTGFSLLALIGGPLLIYGLSSFSGLARVGIALTFAIFVIPKMMTFDFRGDADQFGTLKGLPVKPSAVVIGQISIPTVLTSCIELVFFGSLMLVADEAVRDRVLAILPFVLPFNLLLYSLENLLFLLAPFRVVPVGRMDFEFLGRAMVETIGKMLVMGCAAILALRVGRGISELSGGSTMVFYSSTWLALAAVAMIAVLLVASVFAKREPLAEA